MTRPQRFTYDVLSHQPLSFVLYDLEYTSWKGCQENGWPEGYHKEIVQIGALKCDWCPIVKKLIVVDTLTVLTRPRLHATLSEYFINLTNITQQQVDAQGVSIMQGLETLRKFCGSRRCHSYGNDYDIIELNLNLLAVPRCHALRSWKSMHFDAKTLFEPFLDVSKYTSGTVYHAFDINLDSGQVHNALFDCWSMFVSLRHMLCADKHIPAIINRLFI